MTLYPLAMFFAPLLSQATTERGYTISWFLILLSIILGMIVMLRPIRREEKVPVRKD